MESTGDGAGSQWSSQSDDPAADAPEPSEYQSAAPAEPEPAQDPAAEPETKPDAESPPQYATGVGQVPPVRPPDPIRPFLAPPAPRRRGRDWAVLIFALVVSGILLSVCCVAGYAFYTRNGGVP